MKHGEFDSDAGALVRRIAAHDRFGSKDINEWIFAALQPAAGDRVIELGCGNGKQSVPLARLVGERGHVTAIDISAESLESLKRAAADEGVAERVECVHAGLDEAVAEAPDGAYDRALASFSIYYAQDAQALFANLARLLRPGGTLFFCGPNAQNNREIIAFHHALSGGERGSPGAADKFMEQAPERAEGLFDKIEHLSFENPLVFSSAADLFDYWRSYNLYDQALEDAFREAAAAHFTVNPEFVTVKRVSGLRMTR